MPKPEPRRLREGQPLICSPNHGRYVCFNICAYLNLSKDNYSCVFMQMYGYVSIYQGRQTERERERERERKRETPIEQPCATQRAHTEDTKAKRPGANVKNASLGPVDGALKAFQG